MPGCLLPVPPTCQVSRGQQGLTLGTTASPPAPPDLEACSVPCFSKLHLSPLVACPPRGLKGAVHGGTPQATTPMCTADTHIGHAILDLGTPHFCLELSEVQVGLALGPAEKGRMRGQPRATCFQALLTLGSMDWASQFHPPFPLPECSSGLFTDKPLSPSGGKLF